jgi:hypothetical protein
MWRGGSLHVPVPDVGSSVLRFMHIATGADRFRRVATWWQRVQSHHHRQAHDRPSLIDPLGCNRGNGVMG